jgi:two-component system, OmpR family, heavy metal sensor histidine kinase CusS
MMRSLRWRLIITTAAATALILGLCGITLDATIRKNLSDEFDASLLTTAKAQLPLITQKGTKFLVDAGLAQNREYKRPDRAVEYYEVRDESAKGDTIIRSPSLGDSKLTLATPASDSAVQYLILPDGRPGRAASIRFKPYFEQAQSEEQPASAHTLVFIVTRNTVGLSDTLSRMRWLILAVCSAATIASAALMAILIQRGLRSTGKLAARIAKIDDVTTAERIEFDDAPTEFMPIVQRLNDLLQRLKDTFEREKSFSSDVAHELRTPLSGLETALEVSASQRRSPEEYERVITRCLDVSRRMHAMVDNLLMLARAEAKQLVVQREPMDLAELCREAWIHFQQRAEDRKLNIEWQLPDDCVINSDQEKIRLLLHNFYDNAVSYTDVAGTITILVRRSPQACIEVSNTGSRLSAEDASHVFERFWRGDRARTASGNHCGLGLTLCRNIAQVLGGSIEAKSERGRFTVTFQLPQVAKQVAVVMK